jgi:hypothetical protein
MSLKVPKYFMLNIDVDIEYDKENYKRSKITKSKNNPYYSISFCNILLKALKDHSPDQLK